MIQVNMVSGMTVGQLSTVQTLRSCVSTVPSRKTDLARQNFVLAVMLEDMRG